MPDIRLDQYFTPTDIANRLASIIQPFSPNNVIDSNCGDGELLSACLSIPTCKNFFGIDIDNSVIKNLSFTQPTWHLNSGDSLIQETWSELNNSSFCAAILNPPFSLNNKIRKSTEVLDLYTTASPALSHVLAAMKFGKPKVIAAILPESCASSQLDRQARIRIESEYEIQIVEKLHSKAFSGAVANAFIARMVRRIHPATPVLIENHESHGSNLDIIRGGLPVHLKVPKPKSGVPYIHTTHLKNLFQTDLNTLDKVKPIDRGILHGHYVLFPRVGIPALQSLEAISFHNKVQISDCVMGIRCRNKAHARQISDFLKFHYADFCELYRGTGARYTTVSTVKNWFSKLVLN